MPGASCWYKPRCLSPVMASERERKEDRGREGGRERGWGWIETRSISWWATRPWYFYFCLLSGSLCREGAQTVVELITETITLSHTLCGGTLHPLSSIIKINIKFLPPTTRSRYGRTTNLPPLFSFRFSVLMSLTMLCCRVSRCKTDREYYPVLPLTYGTYPIV